VKEKFTIHTFKYFDAASANRNSKSWFENNQELYLNNVRLPFAHLVSKIDKAFSSELPRIKVDPKSITRPLRPANRVEDQGWVKDFSFIHLSEKKTSLFEWNPGVQIQFGAKTDDNWMGVGLYLVSGRQMRSVRQALVDDHKVIHQIMNKASFTRAWGKGFAGEKYKRFPRGFDPESPAAPYLWSKQFYVHKQFSRLDVRRRDFQDSLIKDLALAMPLFQWLRKSAGLYKR